MKNEIEGLPYNIGDNVKIDYKVFEKLVGQSNKDLKKELMEIAFNITEKPINFEPVFRVVKIKISDKFDTNIAVKVKFKNKISAWMDSDFFKLTSLLLNNRMCK